MKQRNQLDETPTLQRDGQHINGKIDVSDRYGGKVHRQRSWNCSYGSSFAILKKYVILAVYLSMLIATVIILYCSVRIPDMKLWSKKTDEISHGKKSKDSFILMRDRERASYDRLMHYILHPRATCITPKVLGGQIRRNRKLDGDKVVCLEPGPGIGADCVVYSFGIANEWSFDESMQKQFDCSVYSFDPSMTMDDHLHSKGVWFYNFGIGEFDGKITVDDQIWEIKTFDSILQMLGHRNKTIDVLKLDIEGVEYLVLEDLLDKELLNHVNHLCVEIHLPDNPYWNRILNLLKRIESEAGLRHFSTRNNTQMPKMRVPGFFARYEQHFFEMAWYRH